MKRILFKSFFLFLALFGPTRALVAYELCVASMFYNTAPYLKEWIEYHKLIGVDHFWLYNDASTDNWEEVLAPYINSGLVEVFHWPKKSPDWTFMQMQAFQHSLRRAVGITKWFAFIDQDEFILPMKEKSVPECLNKHFSKEVAVYANWRNFGTSYVTLGIGDPMLSQLTLCSDILHSRNAVGKSIVRPECVIIDQTWSQHFCPLKPGFRYVNGDGQATLTFEGLNLVTDGHGHHGLIRINHYAHRDESYFFNVRLPRDGDPKLMMEHYKEFNEQQDSAILDLLETHYPKKYKKIWKSSRTKS